MKKALLIVDTQMNMLGDANPVVGRDRLLPLFKDLIAEARKTGTEVIFIQHTEGPGEEFDPASPGWQLHPELQPQGNEKTFRKYEVDAFGKTELEKYLRAQNITDLIVAGMQTEWCIQTNCRVAKNLGFNVTLIGDGHSTYDASGKTAQQIIDGVNAENDTIAAQQFAQFLQA